MKFFIAKTIYIIYACFFSLLLLMTLGVPETYAVQDLMEKGPDYTETKGLKYNEIITLKEKYVIKEPTETQKYSILILSFTIFFILSAINIILFFRKSYVIIPILTSSITVLCLYILIWLIPNIFNSQITFYLNKLNKLDLNSKLLVLLPFFIIKVFLISFSNWYKIK